MLSKQEKKDYIAAVQCLYQKPSKTPPILAPGAKTRYDDFVATHINQTLSIHGTVRICHPSSKVRSDLHRATSYHGIAISHGPTSKRSGRNAAIRATNPTTTGRNGPMTQRSHLSWMAVRRAYLATESSSLAVTTRASLCPHSAVSVYPQEMEEAVSNPDPLRSEYMLSRLSTAYRTLSVNMS
jgi:hypothetical protein